MTPDAPVLRAAENRDGEGIIELLATVYAEHGIAFDFARDGELLLAVSTVFRACDGGFWVAERDGRIVGSVGYLPAEERRAVELVRLYVAADARRAGIASRLCALVEDAARARAASWIELWSDARLAVAHRFYERRGYRRTGETRTLADGAVEHRFARTLGCGSPMNGDSTRGPSCT